MGYFGAIFYGQYSFEAQAVSTDVDIVLETDWNNDGDFNDAHENLTADNLVLSISSVRGRDYASQLIGRSVGGTLRGLLNNSSGKFSSYNSASPLFGNLLPNRKVRLRAAPVTLPSPLDISLWTGFLSGPSKPIVQQGQLPKAQLEAVGPLTILGNPNTRINPPAMQSATTGQIINAILDAAGWPSAARQIDAGEVVITHWYVENKGALEALQEIEEAEGGFLLEGTNWDIIFEGRYHRLQAAASNSPQASLDDTGGALGYRQIAQDDPLRQIYNDVEVTVRPLALDALAVLWTFSEPFTLAPSESRTMIATLNDSDIAYVSAWTTTVLGTDLVSSGGTVSVSVVKTARTMLVTVTNNHGSQSATVTLLQARGTPVRFTDAFKVHASDAASIALYGKRSFPFPTPWFPNAAYAQASADYTIEQYKDPHAVLSLGHPMPNAAVRSASMPRTLSDRVTVEASSAQTQLGIDGDFYIESIGYEMSPKALPFVSWRLSPVPEDPQDYWVLGTSELGVDTILAY